MFNSLSKKQAGFSLAEMMMQLVILTVVTVPMIMILNMQKNNIATDQRVTVESVQADQLFDRMPIRMSAPLSAPYTVTTYLDGSTTSYYSLQCDPIINTGSPASCANKDKGPFFQRQVSYMNNNDSMRVTVSLYKRKTIDGVNNKAYFQASREYALDIYRVNAANSASPFAVDPSGNAWLPEVMGSTGTDIEYITSQCSPSTKISTLDIPFNDAWDLSSSCSNGLTYYFKVSSDRVYDVNLYFVVPNDQAAFPGCLGTTNPNASCFLADILIDSRGGGYGVTQNLRTYKNFDINAATGMQAAPSPGPMTAPTAVGYVFKDTVRTNTNSPNLSVTVKPSTTSSHAYLAGVEIIRRDDQQ